MKKTMLSLLIVLISMSVSLAQKTASQVVSELCTSTNYPTNNGGMTIAFNLSGHGSAEATISASFGYGECAATTSSIKTKSTNGPIPISYKIVECFNANSSAPAMNYFNPRSGKYAGAKFQLTFTNGPLSNTTTSVGSLKIIYSDGTTKTIALPSNLTVRGTALTTGYTLTGNVAGEFGDEQLTIIVRRIFLGG